MDILVLEASTSSAKAMIISTSGEMKEIKTKKYKEDYTDTSLHNADSIFEQLISLGKEISTEYEISLVALSGAWHSIMLCDSSFKPVTPIYTWAYTGASGVCFKLRKKVNYKENYYKKTGCMVNAIYPFFKLKHLKEKGYDLTQYMIMGEGTYIYKKLTNAFVVMDSMASGSGLMNTYTRKYDEKLLEEVNIEVSQLPEIISYKKTNPLSSKYAREMGLRPGIPVIAAGPDGALNQIGSNAMKKSIMTFSIGTSGALRLASEKPNVSENQTTWCYMTPHGWLSGIATSGACNCVDWAKEKLFDSECTYSSLEEQFKEIDSDGPIFFPFLFGERCPGWNDAQKAQWSNIKPEHQKIDLYHSVLEGVLFNLYQSYLELVKINDVPEVIKLSGGVLHSKYWTQMCADIFNMPIEIDNIKHSSIMGAAILGKIVLTNSAQFGNSEIREVEKIMPNSYKNTMYMERFKKYLDTYHRNK